MSQNVHGHDILGRIIAAGGTLPLSVLRNAALESYGAEAAYFTCSAQGMSFDELMTFLAQRNKIAIAGDTVTVFAQNMCNHDHHDHHDHHGHD
jgi:probable metal-binding protein